MSENGISDEEWLMLEKNTVLPRFSELLYSEKAVV